MYMSRVRMLLMRLYLRVLHHRVRTRSTMNAVYRSMDDHLKDMQ